MYEQSIPSASARPTAISLPESYTKHLRMLPLNRKGLHVLAGRLDRVGRVLPSLRFPMNMSIQAPYCHLWYYVTILRTRIPKNRRHKSGREAPNGLEMSRPASPRLVSRQSETPGWPGRLQRVDYM